ncbi:helix-turn-helix domain-containing protein [Haloimpatiens massiliensis]|uniref:helix-turn-helix domain-containing protein n=1 Tax=Haloimpatiens massiliensis TaxID=1658110 RepID=UPI000C84AC4D|nr:helix-turn-helix transcriptional regulator [Haloimpatiens massiliensis]
MLGKAIKQIREKKGLTQKQLSDDSGISISYIQQLEYGKKENPSTEILKKISEALGVSIINLIDIDGNISKGFKEIDNTIEVGINKTFKDSFSQFISDKRYLLDIKKYKSKEEYDQELENLYNATIEFIEFYCYKLKNKDNK